MVDADTPNISLTTFACRAEKGKMEQQDARATMGLQDALELLSKILPTTRTFVLCLTSKTMRTAVENANRCGLGFKV